MRDFFLNKAACAKKGAALGVICAAFFLAFSCSSKIGYSVVLWEIPQYELEDGDIVAVYFKSSITHTYAIALPLDESQKIEIPLWQLTEPSSRRSAAQTAERFAEYRYQYAAVALDGLPVRSEPVNTARQVYRLKKSEIIKVLYKGEGQAVMIGSAPAEGDWLRVMTNDGTQGWCFSYNLRIFDSREVEAAGEQAGEIAPQQDKTLESILAKKWYPEIYESLILNNTIDLTRIKTEYGFKIDSANKNIAVILPEYEKEGSYSEIVKNQDGSYTLEGSSFAIMPRLTTGLPEPRLIVVTVTDERGMPTANNFIQIDQPIAQIIADEQQRRENLFTTLLTFGPLFSSAHYGSLRFGAGNAFTWNNFRLLTPAVIPPNAANSGKVEFKYFLSRQIADEFDGVMTMRFANVNREINFFYKLEPSGLRLEDASGVVPRNNVFFSRGSSPVVAFFARQ